jgi:ubiquinone/menaquinone biosynthesis C-methylase UbiE
MSAAEENIDRFGDVNNSLEKEQVLSHGNVAKLYCLNWIDRYLSKNLHPVSLLDVGSGRSLNFVMLLKKHPHLSYVGVEPSSTCCEAARANLAGLNATIINAFGYNLTKIVATKSFHLITSFSVLEHVYQRKLYIESISRLLKSEGYFLINFDAGHFVAPTGVRERLKTALAPLKAFFGFERNYQSFVRIEDFRSFAYQAGLKILEQKSFNTALKQVYRQIPEQDRDEFMQRWLDIELWVNSLPTTYSDKDATTWHTLNFVLSRT